MGEPVQLNLQAQHSNFPSFTSNAQEAIELVGTGPCEAKIRRRRAVRVVAEVSVSILSTFIRYKSYSRSDTLVVYFWPYCKNYALFLFIKIFMQNPEPQGNMVGWEKADASIPFVIRAKDRCILAFYLFDYLDVINGQPLVGCIQ